MATRLLSSVVLLPLVAFAVYRGGLLFTVFVGIVVTLAGYEFYSLMKEQGHHPFLFLGLVIIALLTVDYAIPLRRRIWLTSMLVLSLIWPLLEKEREGSLMDWALTLAGAFYVGWFAAHIVMLRALPQGLIWTMITLIGTWFTDSGAYLAGKAWGHHALAPQISPKKTWEGAIGGTVAGTVATMFLATRWISLSMPQALLLGLLIGTAAILGDLMESWIKRQVRAKDSGHAIPGHGGILDRIDSLLLTSVVVYYFALRIGGG